MLGELLVLIYLSVLKSLFFAARSLDPHEIRTREKWVGR
jgi:hypothetical protein